MAVTFEQTLKSLDDALRNLQELKSDREFIEAAGIGRNFNLAGLQWTALDNVDGGCLCLATSVGDRKSDEDSNNWSTSELRKYLNGEFYERLAAEIGEENIIPFTRDLISVDGLTEYGECEDKVSLLTFDEYRKYRSLFQNTNYIWTISPWTIRESGSNYSVAVVSPRGVVSDYVCSNFDGVRPLCIFRSCIFESL